jgi:hypothetical protein
VEVAHDSIAAQAITVPGPWWCDKDTCIAFEQLSSRGRVVRLATGDDADPSAPGGMAEIYRSLIADEDRLDQIVQDVLAAAASGANILGPDHSGRSPQRNCQATSRRW